MLTPSILYRSRRALALIVVVYVLATLGTLAFALAFRSGIGLHGAQLLVERMQQDQIALAACAQACRLLAVDDPEVDSYDDTWSGWHAITVPQGPEDTAVSWQVWWRLQDESAKINVNLAPSDILSRIEGLDEAVVASILDWLDKDDVPNPGGAEKEYYASLSPPYTCRNGPLESLEELAFIKGITADTYFGTGNRQPSDGLNDLALMDDETLEGPAGLSEVLTIYGDGKINLNTVLPTVLRAIPFLSDSAVEEILSRQRPKARKFATMKDIQTNDAFTLADKIVLLQIGRFNSSHFQLQIRLQSAGASSTYEYAAILERDKETVRVFRWQRKLPRRQQDDLYGG